MGAVIVAFARTRPGALCALALPLVIAAALAPPAGAAPKPLRLGTAEPGYASSDPARRAQLYRETADLGARVVRISAFWFRIAPEEPAPESDPTDPDNPAYDFSVLDAAVRDAEAHGLDVVMTIQRAPKWAQGSDRPRIRLPDGVWRPDPEAFGDFAGAVATRYSGGFAPPAQPPLPRVGRYQAWNEPNLRNHLMPQYENGSRASVEIYRELLNQAYPAIKDADPTATVIAAGTAPLESDGRRRVGPETFWRELLCLSPSLTAEPCPGGEQARFDIFDHHPITRFDPAIPGPTDSVLISDFGDLTRILRAAESEGTIAPRPTPRPVWATEIYWKTDPPAAGRGVAPELAASYLQRAMQMLHRRGVSLLMNFFLIDAERVKGWDYRPGGLLYEDMRRKPSFKAFRFPFVADRVGRKRVELWGRSPASGKLRIQRRGKHGWKRLKEFRVRRGEVFRKRIDARGRVMLRAKVDGSKSLVYEQRGHWRG